MEEATPAVGMTPSSELLSIYTNTVFVLNNTEKILI
jgi:hypothetical protein